MLLSLPQLTVYWTVYYGIVSIAQLGAILAYLRKRWENMVDEEVDFAHETPFRQGTPDERCLTSINAILALAMAECGI
jgi:hypothetical protein